MEQRETQIAEFLLTATDEEYDMLIQYLEAIRYINGILPTIQDIRDLINEITL